MPTFIRDDEGNLISKSDSKQMIFDSEGNMTEHIKEERADIVDMSSENLSTENKAGTLSLLKTNNFDIRNFHEEFKDNSEAVLKELLSIQSNGQPLKKGGIEIAYRADAIILSNRQRFSVQENVIFDIISGVVSSNPEDEHYVIYASDVERILGKGNYTYEILKATNSLSDKTLLFEIPLKNGNKRILKVAWHTILTYVDRKSFDENEKDAYISFTPTPFFKALLISSSVSHGAHYSIKAASQISAKYIKNLYYFLESKKEYRERPGAVKGEFTLLLEELQEIIGYPSSYKVGDVKRRILDKAAEELNNIEDVDFYFSYEPVKHKQQYIGIRFKITSVEKVIEANEILPAKEVIDILIGEGLSEREAIIVSKKYEEYNRTIPFLWQVVGVVNATPKIKSKPALYSYYMENGISKPKSSNHEFDERKHDDEYFANLERRLLNEE